MPVKRAAMYIKLNDIVVGDNYILPVLRRPKVDGSAEQFDRCMRAAGTTTCGRSRTGTGKREHRRERPMRPEPARGGTTMGKYILRRLIIALPSLLGISLVLFVLLALAPGDPFGELATNPTSRPKCGRHCG